MKHYILYNPLAGHGELKAKLEGLKKHLEGETVDVDLTSLNNYGSVIEKLEPGDDIILSGGDGTLNNFINKVDTDSLENDVYYYPTGSGNDFINDIGASEDNSPILINKYIKNLPSVTVKGETYRFLNGVGFGIDGYCCEEGDRIKATSTKPVNYTLIAIKGLLFHFKPVTAKVSVDGREYIFKKTWIAPTMNGRCYGGGMIPTPKQDRLGDGSLSFMAFHGTSKLRTLMIFPSIFKGEHVKHTDAIDILVGRDISVVFDRPCALQIDGETILNVTEYRATANVKAKV